MVRAALDRWSTEMVLSDYYSDTSFIPEAILPDPNLTTLASNTRIHTVNDILTVIKPPWILAARHGQEILDILTKLDCVDKDARLAKTLENRVARKRKTAARKVAKKATMTQSPAPLLTSFAVYNTVPYMPARPILFWARFGTTTFGAPETLPNTLPSISHLSISIFDAPKLYASTITGNASKYGYL
ncbi:hypothetical protein C8J57DRAFT_1502483 [Mycena rebaudengoi]|nr:hypothetical protein C8J57DRAFT_1502483 [Mycena rebaudengoi]